VRDAMPENGVNAIDTGTGLNYAPLWLCLYRCCLPKSSRARAPCVLRSAAQRSARIRARVYACMCCLVYARALIG